jgi:hypothetical protein
MLVNNPLLANQPTDNIYNHHNARSKNSQSFVGQHFANPYTPIAYSSLSEDEELDVNTTEHSNNNPWTQATNIKNFMLKRIQEWKRTAPGTSHQQTKEPKPPPIYIHGVTNYRAMTDSLALVTAKKTYHSKTVSNNTVIIYPDKPETYRRLISHFHEKKIIFHTYQLNQERAYRIVIRDIHPSVAPQEIAEELNNKAHKVRNIINVKHRVSKEPLPLFFVALEPNENNKEIYNLQFLYNTKIRV